MFQRRKPRYLVIFNSFWTHQNSPKCFACYNLLTERAVHYSSNFRQNNKEREYGVNEIIRH